MRSFSFSSKFPVFWKTPSWSELSLCLWNFFFFLKKRVRFPLATHLFWCLDFDDKTARSARSGPGHIDLLCGFGSCSSPPGETAEFYPSARVPEPRCPSAPRMHVQMPGCPCCFNASLVGISFSEWVPQTSCNVRASDQQQHIHVSRVGPSGE